MRNRIVGVKNFATEVTKALQDWTQDVQYEVVMAVDEKAKKLVKLLKASSPKETGAYKRNWTSKKVTDNYSFYQRIVHNRKRYQLTHLLENGHRKGKNQKADVKAITHIGPARDQIEKEFEQAVIDAINGSKRGGGGYRYANPEKLIHGSRNK